MTTEKPFYCSFCGKSQYEATKLIAGPGPVFICDECVFLCCDIITEANSKAMATANYPCGSLGEEV